MPNSYELPDINSVTELLATGDSNPTWMKLLRSQSTHMMTGNQQRDAMAVYLSVLTDARKSGWKLTSTKMPMQRFVPPSFSDRDSRKAHIQRILDLRVSEQRQVATVRDFLKAQGQSAVHFTTNPSEIPEAPEDLLNWFDDVDVIQVESPEDKPIYRYLRYSWRIPYSTTPGRTMSFLVRKSNGHVIGIFTLASPTLWMSGRDEAMGFEQLDCKMTTSEESEHIPEPDKEEWINRWSSTGMVDDEHNIHPHSGQYSVSELSHRSLQH